MKPNVDLARPYACNSQNVVADSLYGAYLRLVECLLRDLLLEGLGRRLPLEHLVLPQGEKSFERKLSDREAQDQLLPRKAWAIKKLGKPLWDTC